MLIQAENENHALGASIELTPLIDMVFLLLIFFLVATTFHQTEREMQIALPVASSSAPISAMMQELIVNVDVEGRIIIGCPNMGGTMKPCNTTLPVKEGYSDLVRVEGRRVCLDTVTGLTDGTPPGTVDYVVRGPGQDFVSEGA